MMMENLPQIDSGEMIELCTFSIQKYLFGVDIQRVQEINKNRVFTKVPGSSKFILGVMNLRGSIVTVIDLSLKLGFERTEIGKDTRILIVDDKDECVGLLVHKIGDVISGEMRQVEPPPVNLSGNLAKITQGVLKTQDRLIDILDVNLLLE